MDHGTTTKAVVPRRRRKRQGAPPTWSVVRGMLHMPIKDAVAELDVNINKLRRLCHQNGYPTWPGKMIRYMNRTGMMLGVDAPEGSPWAGLAGPSQLAKVAKTKKKEKELVTLDLIDKVGSSSSSKNN